MSKMGSRCSKCKPQASTKKNVILEKTGSVETLFSKKNPLCNLFSPVPKSLNRLTYKMG